MNTTAIISASERMLTLTRRASVSDDVHTRHDEIIAEFAKMATKCGLIAQRIARPDWVRWNPKAIALHTEASQAEERRCGTFAHAPSEMALVSTLGAAAMVLGLSLSDAATAPTDEHDEAAMAAVEMCREAAE